MPTPENPQTRALYNGDCPICDSEMCRYAAYSEQADLPIAFDDLTQSDLADWGITEDAATRLLHVLHDDTLHIGFDAVLVLWEQMPRYRVLAWFCRLPGVFQVLDWGYANVVARYIYGRHQKRQALGLVRPSRRTRGVSPQ